MDPSRRTNDGAKPGHVRRLSFSSPSEAKQDLGNGTGKSNTKKKEDSTEVGNSSDQPCEHARKK